MTKEEFAKLMTLAKSPELFEKKRQRLINRLISSITNKAEQMRLRTMQRALDSNRDQSSSQVALAKEIAQQAMLKQNLLKESLTAYSDRQTHI